MSTPLIQRGGPYDTLIAQRQRARLAATQPAIPPIQSATAADRSRNPLRPRTFDTIIGQETPKRLLRAAVTRAKSTGHTLDHVLLIAPSGTGKSTFSHALAEEMGVEVYELEAPVSADTLLQLRTTMRDGDILKIEEIHQQGIMERRGKSSATQPEVLYAIMEDRVMPTERGPLPFPHITIVGTTTDEGMLPDAFINRFALRPRLEPYTAAQMAELATRNARALGCDITPDASRIFATACRRIPRELNNLVKNAVLFGCPVTERDAREVLELNGISDDGLTPDMQAMLKFLRFRAQRTNARGVTVYQASVNTIATAIGKSRDSKAISLRVEPYLISHGYVQVTHGGRLLTDAGVTRAEAL